MTANNIDLTSRHCKPCEGAPHPLRQDEIERYLSTLSDWKLGDGEIFKKFEFKNYYQTMAFVNAVAWIAHTEDHHPDLEISYGFCRVRYSTHSVGGLSENDFICAAKVNALL